MDDWFKSLTETFNMASAQHPDLMEPYITRLGDTEDRAEQAEIMRSGLRETVNQRYMSCDELRDLSVKYGLVDGETMP